jgi:hypothetical protein
MIIDLALKIHLLPRLKKLKKMGLSQNLIRKTNLPDKSRQMIALTVRKTKKTLKLKRRAQLNHQRSKTKKLISNILNFPVKQNLK